MASRTSFDELNRLSTTSRDEEAVLSQIRRYFEPMELEGEEVERRISLCEDLEKVFRNLFLLVLGASIVEESSNIPLAEQVDYFKDYAFRNYSDTVVQHGFGTEEEFDDPNTFLGQYARQTTNEIVDKTMLNIVDAYYTSSERSILCAENETNVVANYQRNIDAIKSGYTKKTWVTMHDSRVRKSHVYADGETVGVWDAFSIGDSEMMFPCDPSLGANPREIIRCRCVCKYSGKKMR